MLFESGLLNSGNYADRWTVLSLGQVTIMNDALNSYGEEYTGCWPVQCVLRNVNTEKRNAALNAAHNKGIPSSINQHFNQPLTCHNRGIIYIMRKQWRSKLYYKPLKGLFYLVIKACCWKQCSETGRECHCNNMRHWTLSCKQCD